MDNFVKRIIEIISKPPKPSDKANCSLCYIKLDIDDDGIYTWEKIDEHYICYKCGMIIQNVTYLEICDDVIMMVRLGQLGYHACSVWNTTDDLNDIFVQEELSSKFEWLGVNDPLKLTEEYLSSLKCSSIKWEIVQLCNVNPFKSYFYADMIQYVIRGSVRCRIALLLNSINQKLLIDLLWVFMPERYTLFV